MDNDPELSIIIPSYNEVGNLEELLEKCETLVKKQPKKNIEIVIVDNGSTDNTPIELKKWSNQNQLRSIRYIRVEKNKGYGHGILTGLASAKGVVLGWTHADLQTDLEDVWVAFEIYQHSKNDWALIKGRRKNRPLLDTFFTYGMQVYCGIQLKEKITDINAQPKVFSRQFYERYINEKAPIDFSLDLYVLYMARKNGHEIKEIPVYFKDRKHGIAKGGGSWRGKVKLIHRTLNYIHALKQEIKNSESPDTG